MEYALEVNGISKQFNDRGKKFSALKDVSFRIKKGEILGFLGPNGAGKTTIMNCITGAITPDKGNILVLGESNHNRKIFDRVNGISAETNFHWALKPMDILRFYAKVYGIPKDEAEKRIAELVDMFEIKEFINTQSSQLSTGERARLAFAKSMINKPELLLLDEPTLGLDPGIAAKVRKFIKDINQKEKITILLTSHYMREVEMLAHRVAFINKGKIIDIGDVEKVKQKHFSTYDVWITPKVMPKKDIPKSIGFEIRGNRLFKQMKTTDDMSVLLSEIHSKGIGIANIEVKRPSLEDYFIKLSK